MRIAVRRVWVGGMAGIAAAAALAGIKVQPAAAAMVCKGGFQNVQGSWIATPYCQDELVATVARQYGLSVSASAIRNNPHRKRDVCRIIGRDIRVQETCLQVLPGRGRWR